MKTSAHTLEFDAFDDRTWRLVDTSVATDQAGSVVAYVEKIRGSYHVVWIWGTHGSDRFASLEAIRAAATTLLDVFDRTHSTRPVPIAHRPPVAP